MANDAPLPPELVRLAGQLATYLGDRQMADAAIALVRQHSPDERLALAFLVKLAELSSAALKRALDQPELATDLVFCLGASELVGADLGLQPDWLDFFQNARSRTLSSILEALRF